MKPLVSCTPLAIYRHRLLNVAKALRESPTPDNFTMKFFGNSCGTPCCALGHYAFRRDLQDNLSFLGWRISQRSGGDSIDFNSKVIQREFDINPFDCWELFSGAGCGGAETSEEAATYIERFVARKYPQWP